MAPAAGSTRRTRRGTRPSQSTPPQALTRRPRPTRASRAPGPVAVHAVLHLRQHLLRPARRGLDRLDERLPVGLDPGHGDALLRERPTDDVHRGRRRDLHRSARYALGPRRCLGWRMAPRQAGPDPSPVQLIGSARLRDEPERDPADAVLQLFGRSLHRSADYAGATVTFTYNSSGLLTEMSFPPSRTVTYTYNSSGGFASVTDAAGGVTSYGYNSTGLLTTVTDQDGHQVVDNTYDSSGQVTSQVNALGQTATFSYDAANDTCTYTDPDGGESGRHLRRERPRLPHRPRGRGDLVRLRREPGRDGDHRPRRQHDDDELQRSRRPAHKDTALSPRPDRVVLLRLDERRHELHRLRRQHDGLQLQLRRRRHRRDPSRRFEHHLDGEHHDRAPHLRDRRAGLHDALRLQHSRRAHLGLLARGRGDDLRLRLSRAEALHGEPARKRRRGDRVAVHDHLYLQRPRRATPR